MRTKIVGVAVLLVLVTSAASAQEPPLKSITYRLSMSRPVSHLFEVLILIELAAELKDKPLQLQMARWSPERYGVFDFAKNVQEVRAVGGDGSKCLVTRVNDQTWSVATMGSSTL